MKPIQILIVDDNPTDIRIANHALLETKVNCDIEFALDGEEALSYLNKEYEFEDVSTPDIVFLDLDLPKINGLTILKYIKNTPGFEKTKVVIVSASEANSDKAHAYEEGADFIVQKGYDINQYAEALMDCIEDLKIGG